MLSELSLQMKPSLHLFLIPLLHTLYLEHFTACFLAIRLHSLEIQQFTSRAQDYKRHLS